MLINIDIQWLCVIGLIFFALWSWKETEDLRAGLIAHDQALSELARRLDEFRQLPFDHRAKQEVKKLSESEILAQEDEWFERVRR